MMDGAAIQTPIETWHGCYDGSWRGLITPESFAHPAKFSRGLIQRIILEGLSRGWFAPGDVIADPFGGVACGGVISPYHGLKWVGVELEPKFCKLAKENFDLHVGRWRVLGVPLPELFQGDSRRFAEIIGTAAAVVSSPPYAETGSGGNMKSGVVDVSAWSDGRPRKMGPSMMHGEGYGASEGQIGSLKSGEIDAVISSPPYNKPFSQDHNGSRGGERSLGNAPSSEPGAFIKYGHGDGQIEGLPNGTVEAVVTSPPYADTAVEKNSSGIDIEKNFQSHKRAGGGMSLDGYRRIQTKHSEGYGVSLGQIAREGGETYWLAMKLVYEQCRLALRPGGIMAIVVKDYVQNKAIVPLCDQTMTLLLHLGFVPVLRVRAMLVKESRHAGLFHEQVESKSRKSFFRRLAEKKGSPKIDWEEVLVVRRAA